MTHTSQSQQELLNALLCKEAEYHRACSGFQAECRKTRRHCSAYERLDFPLHGGESPTVQHVLAFHHSKKEVLSEVELPTHLFTLQKEAAAALRHSSKHYQKNDPHPPIRTSPAKLSGACRLARHSPNGTC